MLAKSAKLCGCSTTPPKPVRSPKTASSSTPAAAPKKKPKAPRIKKGKVSHLAATGDTVKSQAKKAYPAGQKRKNSTSWTCRQEVKWTCQITSPSQATAHPKNTHKKDKAT